MPWSNLSFASLDRAEFNSALSVHTYGLPALKQGSRQLHETCFRNVDRAAVAALHRLLISEDIRNMIHDIESGGGDFALVEIGIEVRHLVL